MAQHLFSLWENTWGEIGYEEWFFFFTHHSPWDWHMSLEDEGVSAGYVKEEERESNTLELEGSAGEQTWSCSLWPRPPIKHQTWILKIENISLPGPNFKFYLFFCNAVAPSTLVFCWRPLFLPYILIYIEGRISFIDSTAATLDACIVYDCICPVMLWLHSL